MLFDKELLERKKQIKLILPAMHQKQKEFYTRPERFVVGCMGSKTGKSFGGAIRIVQEAWNTPNGIFWWVAPSYGQCQIGIDEIKKYLPEGRFYHYKKQPQVIELLESSGKPHARIEFKSADDPDNLRGFKVNMALIDEADRISEESYLSVYTTLGPTMGRAYIISTPKTKNGFFYREFCKGDVEGPNYDPNYFSMTLPTHYNPWINPDFLVQAKKNLPEDVFRTEYMAEWPSGDGGTVFKNIEGCILRDATFVEPIPGHSYVMGADLAKHNDWTVLTVMDRATRAVVYWERFNQVEWGLQKYKIVETAKRYNNAMVVMDTTGGSVGDVVLDDLRQSATFPIEGFKISTNALKRQLVENLKLAISNRTIFFPEIKQLLFEFSMFEFQLTDSGAVVYGACSGTHDDCVISLAFAVHGIDKEPFKYVYRNMRGV